MKLEALRLREDREKKFLEEKFKSMNEEDSSDNSSETSSVSRRLRTIKPSNDTETILSWIEDQRKQRPSEPY